MTKCFICIALGFTALVAVAQAQTAPKTAAKKWAPPRTSDGHPDFQGYWANNNATPIERPKELADHPVLSNEEVAAMRQKAKEMFESGNSDAAFGDSTFVAVYQNVKGTRKGFKSVDGETGDYSSVWNDHRVWDNRTSLITDPADGRMPPMTEAAKATRAAASAAIQRPARGPEDRSLSERCISYGSPQLTEGYQSYYQIVQAPNAVAFMTEMIHDVRTIPLNTDPHPSAAVKQWMGDSRGHWEGDTLVIDTTNYKPHAFMGVSTDKLHVTERLSFMNADTLRYDITVDDPGAWQKPWSLMVPLQRSPKPVYEYACHEGNIGLMGILAGARADERAAASK
jgi:hypothetical protein